MADKDAPVSQDAESRDTRSKDTVSKDTVSKDTVSKDTVSKDMVSEDEERLEHLEEEIQAAQQHLRQDTHENEPRFYDEGGEGEGPVPG